MKKITLLTTILVSFIGFAQTNKQNIQTYLDSNKAKLGLTSQDVSDWVIQSEGSSKATKITTCRVVQRYQGIELYDAQSNVWVKDNQVINIGNRFKSNVAQKVNTATPSLSVLQAIARAYTAVGVAQPASFTIAETLVNDKKFLLSDGKQDQITARLSYQETADHKLNLAWAFQFYTPDSKHYWDMTIDALNGTVLSKYDLTISCNFGEDKGHSHKPEFNFNNILFNSNSNMLVATPGTYRVIPFNYESPNHHSFDLITTAGDALASPNGWHDANTIGGTTASLKYTYTRGNNVLAQEDANGDNGTGIRPDGTAALVFDFPYLGPTAQPTAYTSAATTNLFYMNNIMHDIWYNYGFDETNANFQQNNLGRGGVVTAAGDYVQADSQDGYSQTTATLNNANFTPTNDGVRPRIQMFLWTLGAPPTNYLTVNSPASIAGAYAATTNVFEGTDRIPVPSAPNGITTDLVHYTNAPNPNTNPISGHNACVAPTNAFDVSGHIVLIRRGNCNFSNKVKNAQDAGALAAIVYDTVPNNPVRLSMSSTGLLGITIPAVFVTKEIGDALVAEMANGPVNVKLEAPADLYLYADGDFDNVIIGHEYGHGISNRLVGGGAAGCMTNYEQMGEGWSDWFGLMNQLKTGDTGADAKEVGTFVINQPTTGFGIRAFPYSTDLTLNPRTFVDSNAPIPTDPTDTGYRYVVGEFWTSVLWDLTWAYVDKYGFDPDVYNGNGGNNKVMQLVADALKLETCNGTNVVSGRDNLFAAEQATSGGADHCLIADVFARRGVGLNATSGSANDPNDQVEDFTAFPAGPNCTLGVNYFSNQQLVRVYPNPANGMVNVRINQFVGKVNFQIIDLNGRTVYNQTDENFNVEKALNLSSFQSGVYILKIVGDNLNYSQKLIKN
jgi:extracellular elastinolytic metalloproteinase